MARNQNEYTLVGAALFACTLLCDFIALTAGWCTVSSCGDERFKSSTGGTSVFTYPNKEWHHNARNAGAVFVVSFILTIACTAVVTYRIKYSKDAASPAWLVCSLVAPTAWALVFRYAGLVEFNAGWQRGVSGPGWQAGAASLFFHLSALISSIIGFWFVDGKNEGDLPTMATRNSFNSVWFSLFSLTSLFALSSTLICDLGALTMNWWKAENGESTAPFAFGSNHYGRTHMEARVPGYLFLTSLGLAAGSLVSLCFGNQHRIYFPKHFPRGAIFCLVATGSSAVSFRLLSLFEYDQWYLSGKVGPGAILGVAAVLFHITGMLAGAWNLTTSEEEEEKPHNYSKVKLNLVAADRLSTILHVPRKSTASHATPRASDSPASELDNLLPPVSPVATERSSVSFGNVLVYNISAHD